MSGYGRNSFDLMKKMIIFINQMNE